MADKCRDTSALVTINERMALAMLAGARAIEQNPRKYFGTTFVYDVFGDNPQKTTYHDAAKILRDAAEFVLEEKENGA